MAAQRHKMAGEAGIEPTSSVLETEVMPLYDSPSEIVLHSRLTQMIKMRRLREGAPFNVPEERSTLSATAFQYRIRQEQLAKNQDGRCGGIRTHTVLVLSQSSLPFGIHTQLVPRAGLEPA